VFRFLLLRPLGRNGLSLLRLHHGVMLCLRGILLRSHPQKPETA